MYSKSNCMRHLRGGKYESSKESFIRQKETEYSL